MIKRYRVDSIHKIWSIENKYHNWYLLEILVCEAWNKLKVIPTKDLQEIKKEAKYDIAQILELEKEVKHDVIAFTRNISSFIKSDAKRWIHFGLTSTDLVDSSNGMNFYASNHIIKKEVKKLLTVLKTHAKKYKIVEQMGRTHGVHAQLNSLGLKFLNYYHNITRWLNNFEFIKAGVEVVKLSGAIGNYSYQDPLVEQYVANKLKLNIAYNSTQVVSRDRHALYFSVLANLGLIINQIATEIRHLHRTEVSEITESFSKNQKGSSAMPHKKNPVTCENICGMSRLLSSMCYTTWENVNLWHERDISHSSNERIIFEDAINILVYMIKKMTEVLANASFNLHRIQQNIFSCGNRNFTQAIMLHLIKHSNESRETIYDYIQQLAFSEDEIIESLSTGPYKQFFRGKYWQAFLEDSDELKHIDFIYKRVL